MFKRNYFKAVWTAEEAKERFKELVKKLHPDNNPGHDTTEEFKEMSSEFRAVYDELKDVHRRKDDGTTYTETRQEYKATDNGEEFARVFTTLYGMSGLTLQISGSWLWISGNTYEHKEAIKALGCKWSRSHQQWYYTSTPLNGRRSHKSMAEIVSKYGAEIYKSTGADEKQLTC
jgi:hypothetical protein